MNADKKSDTDEHKLAPIVDRMQIGPFSWNKSLLDQGGGKVLILGVGIAIAF